MPKLTRKAIRFGRKVGPTFIIKNFGLKKRKNII